MGMLRGLRGEWESESADSYRNARYTLLNLCLRFVPDWEGDHGIADKLLGLLEACSGHLHLIRSHWRLDKSFWGSWRR